MERTIALERRLSIDDASLTKVRKDKAHLVHHV